MRGIVSLCGALVLVGMVSPVFAGDYVQTEEPCYWCIRDAIYEDVRLIAHYEANPDIDESIKGPEIGAARADIHRLRATLGPLRQEGPNPCCYARKLLYIR
jgi:hypothetical protein